MVRRYPNIVITGTPGTGKSTHASQLLEAYTSPSGSSSGSGSSPLRHIDVGALVKEKGLHTAYDEGWQSYEVDEDRLVDEIEPLTGGTAPEAGEGVEEGEEGEGRGGLILDWHTCDVWPERWVDLVVVLRCDHSVLWERLEKRGYPLAKIQENNEAEIMETVLEDARSSYAEEVVVVLRSESAEEVESNVERIKGWIDAWRSQRGLR